MQIFIMISNINTFVRFTSVFPDIFLVLDNKYLHVFFYISGFSFMNIHDSQDSRRSGRLSHIFENNEAIFYHEQKPRYYISTA